MGGDGQSGTASALAGRVFNLVPDDIRQSTRPTCACEVDQRSVADNDSRVEHVHQRGLHYLLQIDPHTQTGRRLRRAVLSYRHHRPAPRRGRPPSSEACFRQAWDSAAMALR